MILLNFCAWAITDDGARMHLNSFLDVGFAAQPQHRQPVDVGHGHRPIGMDVHGVEEPHCLHSLQLRRTLALHRRLEVVGSWPDHTFHKHLEVLHVGEVRRREHERGSNRERLTLHYGIIMRIRLGGLGRGIRRRTAQHLWHLWHLLRRLRRIVSDDARHVLLDALDTLQGRRGPLHLAVLVEVLLAIRVEPRLPHDVDFARVLPRQ